MGILRLLAYGVGLIKTENDAFRAFPEPDELIAEQLVNGRTETLMDASFSNPNRPMKELPPEERQFEIAECVIDSTITAMLLMRASLDITAGTRSCPDQEDQFERATCAIDITSTFGAFLASGSFLSNVLDSCPLREGPVAQILCASEVTKLFGALSELGSALAGLYSRCPDYDQKAYIDSVKHNQVNRRLTEETEEEAEEERKADVAECINDSILSVLVLAHAGMEITSAAENCPDAEMYQACGERTAGAIGAFGFVTSFLSAAAAKCAETAHPYTGCAEDIGAVVGSLSEIASAASGMSRACVEARKDPEEVDFPWRYWRRRLEEAETTNETQSRAAAQVGSASAGGRRAVGGNGETQSIQRSIFRRLIGSHGRLDHDSFILMERFARIAGHEELRATLAGNSTRIEQVRKASREVNSLLQKWRRKIV